MPKYPEDTTNVSVSPGRWVWNDESQTVEFVSSSTPEEGVLRKRRQTKVNFNLLQRAEWLAEMCVLNHRGRQSLGNSLSPAHLDTYRSSVMKRRGDCVTLDDVKQVAVSLLQENYSLPIPLCFLAVLKSKELDDVLATLLLYLSCFFEYKSLENKPKHLMTVDLISQHQLKAEPLAKKEIAKRKLAVCYFTLVMHLEIEQHQHRPYHKGQMSSNSTEWLLHASLYSFFCYVAWVTFGRKDLRDIQDEVGRLLYSDTFNTAVRNRTDGDSELTSTDSNGSLKMGDVDPKEIKCSGTFKQRMPQRHLTLNNILNQRSPLMVTLFPTPKERSSYLFLGVQAKRQSSLEAEHCDTEALTEQLNQQLARARFGILGKSWRQFSCDALIPHREQKINGNGAEDEAHEPSASSKHPCLKAACHPS